MANKNATLEKKSEFEVLDLDEIEDRLQKELTDELSEFEFLDRQQAQMESPDALGQTILDTVWDQFTNQIAVQAGEDFIKANNGLNLDLRSEAHIQTTENFANGKIATHNTEIDYQKRYDDWQDNFQRDEDGSIKTKFDKRAGKEKMVLKKEARKDFDKSRPKGSDTNHTQMDHTISAAEIIRDPEAAAHMTREEQINFANSETNLNLMDSAANQSKGDSTMSEWLDSERNGEKPADRFDIDEEALRQKDKEAREEYEKQKREAEQRSIEAGKRSQKAEAYRIGKKAVRAIVMNLFAGLIKKLIKNLISWFKSERKNLKTLLISFKDAIVNFVIDLKNNVLNVADTAATVIATSILGPVIGTIKKAWMFIKQGWSSLKKAIDYIRKPENKGKPVGVLMMEVGKIVIAGLTAAGAIVLGEIIEKNLMVVPLLAIEIPLFGSLANIIGIFMGAVVSGIIGALAINLINRLISKRQKGASSEEKVKKGNEILATQEKIMDVVIAKVNNTKADVSESIIMRHKAAANSMRNSLKTIKKNEESDFEDIDNSEDFAKMNRRLRDLGAE